MDFADERKEYTFKDYRIEIKEYLWSRGLKYKWLASQIGISESYMSLLISGKRDWNQGIIEKTADVLDIQTDRLLQMINQNIINNRESNGKYI